MAVAAAILSETSQALFSAAENSLMEAALEVDPQALSVLSQAASWVVVGNNQINILVTVDPVAQAPAACSAVFWEVVVNHRTSNQVTADRAVIVLAVQVVYLAVS